MIPASRPLIHLDQVSWGYGAQTILRGVSCAMSAGQFVGLVGPNGSGKTTFLKGILGLLPPQAGRLDVDRARRFAYVPQAEEINLFWPLSVRETVSLARRSQRLLGRLAPQDRSAVNAALSQTGLSNLADKPLREVSGGQRQRAILAQALSQEPAVLLLDEPTRGLDVVAEHEFLGLLRELNQRKGLTVLLVTHTLSIPLNFADKILLFNAGSVFQTDPEELVKTNRLEEIYGIPFLHQEASGQRWISPQERAGKPREKPLP